MRVPQVPQPHSAEKRLQYLLLQSLPPAFYTYLNDLIINNKEISLDDYNKLRENNIGNEDIKTETIFYENGIIYKYIVQNGVKLLEVDAEKEFIIPKGFIVFSELENYDTIRKHIPIKKYMLKK